VFWVTAKHVWFAKSFKYDGSMSHGVKRSNSMTCLVYGAMLELIRFQISCWNCLRPGIGKARVSSAIGIVGSTSSTRKCGKRSWQCYRDTHSFYFRRRLSRRLLATSVLSCVSILRPTANTHHPSFKGTGKAHSVGTLAGPG
jgi:hypothetical protein